MRHQLLFFQILCKLWQIGNSPCRSRYCNGHVSIETSARTRPTTGPTRQAGPSARWRQLLLGLRRRELTLTDNCNKLRVGISTIMLCYNSERVRYLPKPSYTYKSPTNSPIWLRHCIVYTHCRAIQL